MSLLGLGPARQRSAQRRRNEILRVFCGIDWAEDHHDVALVDAEGKLVAKRRIGDDAAGFAALLALLAAAGDSGEEPFPVAIETSRGLLVACLRATGRDVFAINPWRCPAVGIGTPGAQEVRRRGRAFACWKVACRFCPIITKVDKKIASNATARASVGHGLRSKTSIHTANSATWR